MLSIDLAGQTELMVMAALRNILGMCLDEYVAELAARDLTGWHHIAGPTLDLTLRFGHRPEFDRLGCARLRTGAFDVRRARRDMRASREPGQLSSFNKNGRDPQKGAHTRVSVRVSIRN